MSEARRAQVELIYEHVNISADIAGYKTAFSYTDPASGESDRISLTVQDRDKKWMNGWTPNKGDHISADLKFSDWNHEGDDWSIYCGDFEIDDVTMTGPPASCRIGALSIPRSEAFNEEQRTKNWEAVTVQEIATEIAGRAGIALHYEAEDIPIKAIEQDKKTDCKFLYAVCHQYGLALKVFDRKIIIFDEAVYEQRPPVGILSFNDFRQYNYNSTLAGTYSGAKIAFTDPATGEDHIVTVGSGSRILEINETADSLEDARRKAVAALNNANKKDTTFSGSVMANKMLTAGQCIRLAGFGTPDGVYYLDKVVTKIGSNGASTQNIEAHRAGQKMEDLPVTIDFRADQEGAVTEDGEQ